MTVQQLNLSVHMTGARVSSWPLAQLGVCVCLGGCTNLYKWDGCRSEELPVVWFIRCSLRENAFGCVFQMMRTCARRQRRRRRPPAGNIVRWPLSVSFSFSLFAYLVDECPHVQCSTHTITLRTRHWQNRDTNTHPPTEVIDILFCFYCVATYTSSYRALQYVGVCVL